MSVSRRKRLEKLERAGRSRKWISGFDVLAGAVAMPDDLSKIDPQHAKLIPLLKEMGAPPLPYADPADEAIRRLGLDPDE